MIGDNINKLGQAFISIEDFFNDKEKIVLNNVDLKLFLNGTKLIYKNKDDTYRIYDDSNTFIGTGILSKNKLKRDIVLN